MRNRLPAQENTGKPKEFSGHQIDRNTVFTFLLDGYEIPAFAGDTILSAALATGITGAGYHANAPIGLSEQFAPQIFAIYPDGTTSKPLDMARTYAKPNAKFQCVGAPQRSTPRKIVQKLQGKQHHNLQVDFNTTRLSPLHASSVQSWEVEKVDVVIVGGGIAGMSAAAALGEAGRTVVLIERRSCLGGNAELFGNRDGEEPIRDLTNSLTEKLMTLSNVDVRLLCDALEAQNGQIITHTIVELNQKHKTIIRSIDAKQVILATGCADRLPVFGGNRAPGVLGLASSFHLAQTFGVWTSGETIIAGNTSGIYRVGLCAQDVNSQVLQIADTRVTPNSRFRDFAKAYGIKLAAGTQVRSVESNAGSSKLIALMGLSWEEDQTVAGSTLHCDQLIVSQGWVPQLMLWKQLGGPVAWNTDTLNIAPSEAPANVQLVGSAAGYIGAKACLESAAAASSKILTGEMNDVREELLDEIYESADALPIRTIPKITQNPAYLATGAFSIARGPEKKQSTLQKFLKSGIEIEPGTPGDRALSLLEIEALTRLGLLDDTALENVLTERMISPLPLAALNTKKPATRQHIDDVKIPEYLLGRFGQDPLLCEISTLDARQFAAGSLIYETSDDMAPHQAIGCVLQSQKNTTLAMINQKFGVKNAHIFVAEIQRTTPSTVSALR